MATFRTTLLALSALPLFALACSGPDEGGATRGPDVDEAELKTYRDALPDSETLSAPVIGGDPDPSALTLEGNSELAKLAAKTAISINRPARLIVATLRAITRLPPTTYDADEQSYTWGPWENDDGYGQVLAYIKKLPADADFAFEYALVRLTDDADSLTPVIWGAGTPKADEATETGGDAGTDEVAAAGVTLWDFEANRAFEKEYDPGFDGDAATDRGRFAMLFGKGSNDEGTFRFNVAVFRDFISKDAEADEGPADLDYYYGHFKGNDGHALDFVDWDLSANLCGGNPEACFDDATVADLAAGKSEESLTLTAAFFDRQIGRAEATVSGGDLSTRVEAVECWSDRLEKTFTSLSVDGTLLSEEGACGAPFEQTLAALGVPALSDVDPEVLHKLDCVATSGAVCE